MRSPAASSAFSWSTAIRLLWPCLALAIGCKGSSLSKSWVVDRLRILAVRPEPAEASPGGTIAFGALVVPPELPVQAVLWFACIAEATDEHGCTMDTSAFLDVDFKKADEEDLKAMIASFRKAGGIGIEPYFPPSYAVPEDALAGLDEEQLDAGVNLFVQVIAIPEGATSDADVELAYKRVPISEARTPNHNPDLVGVRIDGVDVPAGATLDVDAGQTYTVEAVLADDALETYAYLDSEGTWEERDEQPYFTFYFQGGDVDQDVALWPDTAVEWTAPVSPDASEQNLWVVARDRRGGMGWWSQAVRIR
jgi:hypothetical protein